MTGVAVVLSDCILLPWIVLPVRLNPSFDACLSFHLTPASPVSEEHRDHTLEDLSSHTCFT
jgi:hypothetical protein